MRVVIINTSDSGGGAALASKRLFKALEGRVSADMIVQQKGSAHPHIRSASGRIAARFNFLRERLPFIVFHERDKSVRFAFSTANAGADISRIGSVQKADVLHLHWINAGFLSLTRLRLLFRLRKPVVWTLHDMWPFTGGCHYSGSCDHFESECGDCPLLKDPGKNDLSHRGWLAKTAMYAAAERIVFVACSHWMAETASRSSLLKGKKIVVIPNPVDTGLFCPGNGELRRKKMGILPGTKVILFGAANINDRRKGLSYLVSALQKYSAGKNMREQVEIVLFGKNTHFDTAALPFRVHNLSVIGREEDMAEVYRLADVFVLPSLEDNLPNMVMEALSCGVPVVAFNTGGLPDMIDHGLNGYLAEYRSAEDLARGIHSILSSADPAGLAANARKKVLDSFSEGAVAAKYAALYQSMLDG